MSWSPGGIVYNRTDCPYGCGTALPAKVYGSATPCPGCQRPLYAHWARHSDDDSELWPPQDVPRPPFMPPEGTELWYVVGEEDHAEWTRIRDDQKQAYVRRVMEERSWVGGCITAWIRLWDVVDAICLPLFWGLPRLLRRILGSGQSEPDAPRQCASCGTRLDDAWYSRHRYMCRRCGALAR